MSYVILVMIIVSILIGSLTGGLFVSMIYLFRQDKTIDSMIKPEDLIGMSAIVEVPFDASGKGKIQVKINNSVLYLSALTTETKQLTKGQKVLILQASNNKIWVVEDDFT